jgi:hypothetical protein
MVNSLAGRRMPTPLANYTFLRFRSPAPLADRWRSEVAAVFRDAPPPWVVLELPDLKEPDQFFCMNDIRPEEPVAALKEAVERSYVADRRVGHFVFFRKDDAPKGGAPSRPVGAMDSFRGEHGRSLDGAHGPTAAAGSQRRFER